MFYGACKRTFLKALELSNNMTEAEKILWSELRKREVFKERWRPQHPVDIFIVTNISLLLKLMEKFICWKTFWNVIMVGHMK